MPATTSPTTARRVEALRRVRDLSRSPTPTTAVGMCLRNTREALDVHAGAPDAIAAWRTAEHQHRVEDRIGLLRVPPGVPLFWDGGSQGHGHVALAAKTPGWCWSVDIARLGYWDRVPVRQIERRWGLPFLGWTADLNGVVVYDGNAR